MTKEETPKTDLQGKISLDSSVFGKLNNIFLSKVPNTLKSLAFNQCAQTIQTYDTERIGHK